MNRHYPAESSTKPYLIPKKNVLLISCIDLRLTDDLVHFMDSDNLTNRYDHFVLAGTSLGYYLKDKPDDRKTVHSSVCQANDTIDVNWDAWYHTLDEHIRLAIALHNIADVYIVEHENCGAYSNLLSHSTGTRHCKNERTCQEANAKALAAHITGRYCYKDGNNDEKPVHAHAFRMDLRGNVEYFGSFPEHDASAPPQNTDSVEG